jgi:hypothetical protein
MKKYLLAFLLAFPITSHGMDELYYEESDPLVSIYDGSSLDVPKPDPFQSLRINDPEKVLTLREEKIKLEESLKLDKWVEAQKLYDPIDSPVILFQHHVINNNPTKFLQYIYYRKFHESENEYFNLNCLKSNANLLLQCKQATIENYSALGAAVIAKDVDSEEKRELIEKLISMGFEPTLKDKELAYLELYERSSDDIKRKLMLAYGHNNQQSPLSKIPHEIVRYIGTFVSNERSLIPK